MTALIRRQRPLMIAPRRYSDPVVRALEADLQQVYVDRYGGIDDAPAVPEEFDPPGGVFLVGFVGDEPVATGGYRRHDDTTVEIKRMYVASEFRGSGYARQLLAALEEHARANGYTRAILETGSLLPEAVALYRSSGYAPAAPFGHYAEEESSLFFGKQISP